MSVRFSIDRLLRKLARALRLVATPPAVSVQTVGEVVRTAAEAPAVAAFEKRVVVREPTNFRLAARLLSVQDLNTVAGRKPYKMPGRVKVEKPIPKSALGGKKVRNVTGPMVVIAKPRRTAEILVLPVRERANRTALRAAA